MARTLLPQLTSCPGTSALRYRLYFLLISSGRSDLHSMLVGAGWELGLHGSLEIVNYKFIERW